jgi:GDPmannose 4,6-dehydratase
MYRKAIVIGCNGQDGILLFELLKQKNYQIIGIDKNIVKSFQNEWNITVDITNQMQVSDLIAKILPDEIYFLPAFHHSAEDLPPDETVIFENSYIIHVKSFLYVLEAIKKHSILTRIFYAASSHIFGAAFERIQNEDTPFNPHSIYGITKLSGFLLGRFYRENFKIFAANGILYNHESHLREEKFVTKKIIKAALNIKNNMQDKLVLGDLKSIADWGYAPDYVEAMWKILNNDSPDDFIIATGEEHTVEDFVRVAFSYLGLDWRKFVSEQKNIIKKKNIILVGNSEKLRKTTQWTPSISFEEMIRILLIKEGANLN